MGALLLISAIIIGLFLYIKIITFLDHKKYYTQHQNIFTAHKEIGYPNLTEEQQFDILDNENTTYISKLTKYDFVPTGLLNYYINIDPGKYFAHLKNLNLKDKIKFDPTCLKDGFFINKKKYGYQYLFVERQRVYSRKRFFTYDRLLKYVVYKKLSLYAPRKYKMAWLYKYC